jgi:hypothetical protein
MKTYAVNLTVDTKTTDLYDQVAVNKYPVIVLCENSDELWDWLKSQETANWVRTNIRQKHLYESAYFYIREISEDNVKDLQWKVTSIINMIY